VDPKSALFLAIIVAAVVMGRWGDVITGTAMGAADHGRAQVASEARRAKQAVVDNTKASWRKRLEDGQAKGPKSAIWWGVAAARSARKVHRALRRPGDRSVSLPSAGPIRRIVDATAAGGRAGYRRARAAAKNRKAARSGWRERARQAARNGTAWRAAHRRDHATDDGTATGVCDRCGVTCAVTALEQEGALRLCALCRAPAAVDDTGTPDALPAPGAAVAAEGDEAVYGELIPVPAMAAAVPTTTRNGELMAGTGALARRTAHATPAVASGGHSADIANHGDWDRLTQQAAEALEVTTQCLEAMLGHLTAADAGRTQMADIRNWADRVQAAVTFIRSMLTEVNGRIHPLIDAVSAAGGPSEVASPGYHSDY
jgi:hypothetical protein